jgi:hypothetical protein
MKNVKISIAAVLFLVSISAFLISFKQKTNSINRKESAQKCLIISDIHFNPLYGTSLNDTVLKRKLEYANFDEWKAYFEGFTPQMSLNTNLLYQDANYAVLKAALLNMKKRLPHPAFIVIAGDFIWHGATPADSILKKKSILFISRLFKENFPGALIVSALGNNDTYGQDYDLQNAKFLNDFANAWAPNLPRSSGDSLKAHGYYTCETGNMEFVVINSASVCAGENYKQPAAEMLKWLQQTLANTNGKNVWIIMHIPPGLNGFNKKDLWEVAYKDTFVGDIIKYAPSVKLMIASHTHFNDFKVVYDRSKYPAPVALMRIVPSICSNHGNYPSFEVADFNPSTGGLITETNWYLRLPTVSDSKINTHTIWTDSLSLPKYLQLNKINAAGFSKLIDHIKSDKTGQMVKDYANFYDVGTTMDSVLFINHKTYRDYLQADSLKQR